MNIDSFMVGERWERKLHPAPSLREIYIRPAIHPDTAPLPIGDELRERIAAVVEAHAPYVWRKVRTFAYRWIRASIIARVLCWVAIAVAIGYFAHALLALAHA